eukprot:448610-Prorocentrum_minimum.AAC.5
MVVSRAQVVGSAIQSSTAHSTDGVCFYLAVAAKQRVVRLYFHGFGATGSEWRAGSRADPRNGGKGCVEGRALLYIKAPQK